MEINIKVGLDDVQSEGRKPVFWRNLLSAPSRVHHVCHNLHTPYLFSDYIYVQKKVKMLTLLKFDWYWCT